jgi:hypothetical protein
MAKKRDRAKKEALDKTLRGVFSRLQQRPTPERLISIVDQLEAQDAAKSKKSRAG